MKRWTSWLSFILIIALLTACGADAGRYIKDEYPLVSVDGKGTTMSKVYAVEGKNVPTVANELTAKEKPKEKSKESEDQMFLIYKDKVINIQKDPSDSNNTLVQLDSIEYAKSHYDSSFLQGYLTASLIQSIFGGGWNNNRGSSYDYRGYTKTPNYKAETPTTPTKGSTKETKPTTSDRTGGFTSGAANPSSGSSSTARKNDGSTPSKVTKPTTSKPSTSKPSTTKKTGSFKRR